MKLRVIAATGCSLPGWGSRRAGEEFELPDDVAQAALADNPTVLAASDIPVERAAPAKRGKA